VLGVGRHRLAKKRRKSPVVLAALLAPATIFFAAAGDVRPLAARQEAKPVIGDIEPCCLQIVTAAANTAAKAPDTRLISASRYHTRSRFLPVGIAPEQGLQVRTILVERAISVQFPQIHQIGGVRPDPLPWHPMGLAIDVMIPDPGSSEGIALGNAIVAYVMKNASRFGIQDAIWRGVYYTPG
jgi:hypothetical protein